VGGETATLKGLVNGLDLAGTCLGIAKKGHVIKGEKVKPGDTIIGVASSGIHSNGLTLARRVVEEHADYRTRLSNGRMLGEELLTPTRIYHESLRVARRCTVHGMCHVTGGGLLNFKRLSTYGFHFTDPIKPPEIFSWIQVTGTISIVEMYRTFNMGMGYAYIVPEASVRCVLKEVIGAKVVGEIIQDTGAWLGDQEIT